MSEETKKQAVVDGADDQTEDKNKSQSDSKDSDARDDDDSDNLNELLSQWDESEDKSSDKGGDESAKKKKSEAKGSSKSKSGSEPETEPDWSHEVRSELEAIRREREDARKRELAAQAEKDMEGAVKAVRGDLDPDTFDYDFVESWISAQARRDQRIERAWHDRHKSPKQFERVLNGLGKQLAKRFEDLPDKQATEDREAVSQAVRGASNKTPDKQETDYKNLSDKEFSDMVEKEHGFRPF